MEVAARYPYVVTNTTLAVSRQAEASSQMLWNWYTVDACFIARTWHITTPGMFGGSCIGVILLVVVLEMLRRLQREYDRHIAHVLRQSSARHVETMDDTTNGHGTSGQNTKNGSPPSSTISPLKNHRFLPSHATGRNPSMMQQIIRAAIHTAQFAVAYFVMLLAMYYNGYIIICIFIGAFIGHFVCSWDFSKSWNR